MENLPLYHTCPMMNMYLYEHREASTALALAAKIRVWICCIKIITYTCALGVILVSLHDLANKHSSLHSSFDIYPIVQRRWFFISYTCAYFGLCFLLVCFHRSLDFLAAPSPWRLHCSFDGILALKIMFIMLFNNFFTWKLDPIICSFYLLFKWIGLK